jgi:RecJ-like exonuclease
MERKFDVMRYNVKKCFPLVTIYLLGLFCILWFAQSKLQAFGDLYANPEDRPGQTQFKQCNWCGELNYQSNPTCSTCGMKSFTDAYLKPDCEKRDARRKKHAKGFRVRQRNYEVKRITESSDEKKTKSEPMHRA